MLHIHFANRFETLTALLLARLAGSPATVFSQDQVIVPSAAVQRYLTLAVARQQGICTQLRCAYLARWLWEQIGQLVPGVAAESPFDPAVLVWRIHAALGDAPWLAAHPRLASYLQRADPVMQLDLARRLAGLFDQTITYRPDWLAAWSRGEAVALAGGADAVADQAWQAALWRRLAAETGTAEAHPAAAFVRALAGRADVLAVLPATGIDVLAGLPATRIDELAGLPATPIDELAGLPATGIDELAGLPATPIDELAGLPASVHVFALPAMPPLHLGLLQALGARIDVHVYALNPCREYWFEVVDRRRLAGLAARGRDQHHEEGHRLLAAWGRQTQSQLSLLVDAAGEAAIDDAHFEEPASSSLLARLQSSVLDMTDLAPGSIRLAADDRSVEVHVCHSLGREIEVLHDRLLALFAAAAGPEALALGDVLVVTPDLEAAAPLVDAVFGTAPRERFIPYTITGRARSQVNPAARVLLELLALAPSRWPVSAVFGVLQQPLVARRFGLGTDDLERVHRWLQDAGVHWAQDADHRASLGMPAEGRHSFTDGLARLWLGYALPSAQTAPFDGRLPTGDAEGTEALALGALDRFMAALAELRRSVSAPLTADAWPALLADTLARFTAPRDSELDDHREVYEAIDALATDWQNSGLQDSLGVDVVHAALADGLDDPARGGVPTGMVTFSAMSSLRSLPFKVMCAIGLNDGAFPSATRPAEFDLMALQPRLGDRQRRHDERTLFLDLLLAARNHVYLSFVGRSVRDNTPLPPSVLVSELLEALLPAVADAPPDADTYPAALARARARLVVTHPLQAFSEAAFRIDADPRQRSFHSDHAEALRRRRAALASPVASALPMAGDDAGADDDDANDTDAAGEPAAPFFALPLNAPDERWREVSVEQLIRFFRNPCRYLLERRLGLTLRRDEDELQDDEPFVPSVPDLGALADRLLPALWAGADLASVRALALAGTELPAGAFGERVLERELAGLQDFAGRVAQATREPTVDPHRVSLALDVDGQAWRLSASFADLRASGLVRHRCDDLRAMDHLSGWLQHLMLCASPPAGVAAQTTWWARDGCLVFRPPADPRAVLTTLLRLYAQGLREPLNFFPKTAFAYVSKNDSLSAATQAWRVSAQRPFAEGVDAAYRLALRGRPDPLGPGLAEFHATAHAVFDPLLAALAELAP